MGGGVALPKFRKPPLIEVVHGVQFRQLPMSIVHPGLFYMRVRDRYPLAQTVAPLAPLYEAFDRATPSLWQIGLAPRNELPRVWFVSPDDTMLIQLQPDRLLLNWRRGLGSADYPHFETVSAEFRRVYQEFEAFVEEQEIGVIETDQCEMTYINHIVPAAGSQSVSPESFLRIWNDNAKADWDVPVEDIAFTSRYVLRDHEMRPIGRLTASLATLFSPGRDQHILQLDITARGAPQTQGLPGVITFHEMAHEQIVRCFAGITGPEAHEAWERWQ